MKDKYGELRQAIQGLSSIYEFTELNMSQRKAVHEALIYLEKELDNKKRKSIWTRWVR